MHSVHFYEEKKNLERCEKMVKFYCPLKKKRYKKEEIEEMCKDCPRCKTCNTGLAVTKGECGEEGAETIPPFSFLSMPYNGINKEGRI